MEIVLGKLYFILICLPRVATFWERKKLEFKKKIGNRKSWQIFRNRHKWASCRKMPGQITKKSDKIGTGGNRRLLHQPRLPHFEFKIGTTFWKLEKMLEDLGNFVHQKISLVFFLDTKNFWPFIGPQKLSTFFFGY